ncbi:MAG TPA: hypothetical protein VFW51_08040 [Actinomycetota bacterium]|nr:hypothetical protein [Actinomycetota bacterium]
MGAVMASAVAGFRTLARQHLELTRIEVVEAASVRGQGVALLLRRSRSKRSNAPTAEVVIRVVRDDVWASPT